MFWATKQKQETSFNLNHVETCAVCKHNCNHEIIGVRNYFTLYGIAFFPTSKSLFRTCSNCKFVKEIKLSKLHNALDAYAVEELFNSKKKWKYYSGFYVLGVLLIIILYFVYSYEL